MKKNEVYKIYGTDYINMTKELLAQAELSAIIHAKSPDKEQPRIAIKPNLVSPTPAEFGATTHPEVVAGLVEYLKEHGFSNIKICEGSWVGDKTSDSFEYCGFNRLSETYQIPLVDTQTDSYHSMQYHGNWVNICDCMKDVDFLINVPVLKGHCQTKITCALKNLKGLIPNREKRRFHTLGIHKPLAMLNACLKQDFILVDHICGDPDFEDGGNPLETNCVMAALDPVLCDSYCARLLQYEPKDVEYISCAAEEGVGSMDLDSLEVQLLKDGKLETLDENARFYEGQEGLRSRKVLELNYATDAIDSCSACYSSLTSALDQLSKEGLLNYLTEELGLKFCIGQGYKKQENPSSHLVGIGNCTHFFARNIPGCPPAQEDIYQYLRDLCKPD